MPAFLLRSRMITLPCTYTSVLVYKCPRPKVHQASCKAPEIYMPHPCVALMPTPEARGSLRFSLAPRHLQYSTTASLHLWRIPDHHYQIYKSQDRLQYFLYVIHPSSGLPRVPRYGSKSPQSNFDFEGGVGGGGGIGACPVWWWTWWSFFLVWFFSWQSLIYQWPKAPLQ